MSLSNKMDEIAFNIRELLTRLVLELSDKAFQERVWLRGEGPEVGSVGEFFCNFFDDLNINDIIENYKSYEISDSQIEKVIKLKDMLENYSNSIPSTPNDKEVLKDPKWKIIRDFAKEVYIDLIKSAE